jgi:hypothetical protein
MPPPKVCGYGGDRDETPCLILETETPHPRRRSPRRPLVPTPHDAGVLERLFAQMLQGFGLAQSDTGGGRRHIPSD